MKVTLRNGRELCNNSEPYIIAEIGANHNGEVAIAEKLIIAAKNAGADCIKFQSWSKSSIFAPFQTLLILSLSMSFTYLRMRVQAVELGTPAAICA